MFLGIFYLLHVLLASTYLGQIDPGFLDLKQLEPTAFNVHFSFSLIINYLTPLRASRMFFTYVFLINIRIIRMISITIQFWGGYWKVVCFLES